jgi:hypothetical protein
MFRRIEETLQEDPSFPADLKQITYVQHIICFC